VNKYSEKLGILDVSQPYGLPQPVAGIAYVNLYVGDYQIVTYRVTK
jgi:hypothetical protein